nr:hypothetical protein [Tanacetum cinerariifolium]
KKRKSISSTKASSKFEAEITSSSYGFVWTNENCQFKWKVQQPTEGELDLLFEAMYDDYFGGQPSANVENVLPAQESQVCQTSTASTTIADNVLIPTNSSSHATNIPITSQDVDELNTNAMVDGNTFVNPERYVISTNTQEMRGDLNRK